MKMFKHIIGSMLYLFLFTFLLSTLNSESQESVNADQILIQDTPGVTVGGNVGLAYSRDRPRYLDCYETEDQTIVKYYLGLQTYDRTYQKNRCVGDKAATYYCSGQRMRVSFEKCNNGCSEGNGMCFVY